MKLLYIMLLQFPGWMHSLDLMKGKRGIEEEKQ